GRADLVTRGLRFDDVYDDIIYPHYGIELDESRHLGADDAGKKILGCYEPTRNRALIDRSLRDDPRRVFTLWHEVGGHGVLQGQWFRDQLNQRSFEAIVTTDASLAPDTVDALERQANIFASHAAAPSWLVDAVIAKVFRPTKLFLFFGPCLYWLEVNGLK